MNKGVTCVSRSPKLLILTTLVQTSEFSSKWVSSLLPRERKMALRAAILRHVRVPVKTLTLAGRKSQPWGLYGASLRFLSSHGDDHLSKDEVIERVLSVIKSFPKVDPSQVSPSFSLFHFLEKIPVWFATKQFFMCLILLLNR